MSKARPIISYCDKCHTENSYLTEYDGRWLCKINGCYEEETEKNSGIHEEREQRLEDYRRMCQGTNIGG